MCRKANPASARRLVIDPTFDAADSWVQNTTKASVLESMHNINCTVTGSTVTGSTVTGSTVTGSSGSGDVRGAIVVVCRSAVTAMFVYKMMRIRNVPVIDYSRVHTPAQLAKVRAFTRGILLVSARLVGHSLTLCDAVSSVVFFEPSMARGCLAPYATAWSCEASAVKKVLYTAGSQCKVPRHRRNIEW